MDSKLELGVVRRFHLCFVPTHGQGQRSSAPWMLRRVDGAVVRTPPSHPSSRGNDWWRRSSANWCVLIHGRCRGFFASLSDDGRSETSCQRSIGVTWKLELAVRSLGRARSQAILPIRETDLFKWLLCKVCETSLTISLSTGSRCKCAWVAELDQGFELDWILYRTKNLRERVALRKDATDFWTAPETKNIIAVRYRLHMRVSDICSSAAMNGDQPPARGSYDSDSVLQGLGRICHQVGSAVCHRSGSQSAAWRTNGTVRKATNAEILCCESWFGASSILVRLANRDVLYAHKIRCEEQDNSGLVGGIRVPEWSHVDVGPLSRCATATPQDALLLTTVVDVVMLLWHRQLFGRFLVTGTACVCLLSDSPRPDDHLLLRTASKTKETLEEMCDVHHFDRGTSLIRHKSVKIWSRSFDKVSSLEYYRTGVSGTGEYSWCTRCTRCLTTFPLSRVRDSLSPPITLSKIITNFDVESVFQGLPLCDVNGFPLRNERQGRGIGQWTVWLHEIVASLWLHAYFAHLSHGHEHRNVFVSNWGADLTSLTAVWCKTDCSGPRRVLFLGTGVVRASYSSVSGWKAVLERLVEEATVGIYCHEGYALNSTDRDAIRAMTFHKSVGHAAVWTYQCMFTFHFVVRQSHLLTQ